MHMVPTEVIGTDPTTADNIADHRYDLRKLGWSVDELARMNVQLIGADPQQLDLSQLSSARAWPTSPPSSSSALPGRRHPAGTAKDHERLRPADRRTGTARLQGPPAGRRLGDPPFLHNGSVPNLFQLLSPAAERSPQFYVGTFEFDPKFVGFRTEKFPGGFLLDTRLTGNRNSGHEFATAAGRTA